jgi:hypothetical protein
MMDTPIPHALSEAFKSIERLLLVVLPGQVTLNVSSPPASWMILYDPHELKSLFCEIGRVFKERCLRTQRRWYPTLRITFKADAHHAIVYLTIVDFRLMPPEWESFVHQLSEYPCYEHLYELDGGIEPLTWDEGYGQGVIVRLPWA